MRQLTTSTGIIFIGRAQAGVPVIFFCGALREHYRYRGLMIGLSTGLCNARASEVTTPLFLQVQQISSSSKRAQILAVHDPPLTLAKEGIQVPAADITGNFNSLNNTDLSSNIVNLGKEGGAEGHQILWWVLPLGQQQQHQCRQPTNPMVWETRY